MRNSTKSANASALEFLDISRDKEAFLKAAQNAKCIININHPLLFEPFAVHAKMIHFATHDFERYNEKDQVISFASYSHENGTLINCDGIIQKFQRSHHDIHHKHTLLSIFTQIDTTLYATHETLWSQVISKKLGLDFSQISKSGTKIEQNVGVSHA